MTWTPIYYRGEASPSHIGLYHPPLYIYLLATFIKIFGFTETTVRMFGAICSLVSAFLVFMIFRTLFTKKKHRYFELIFLGLFLFHPYTVANATLPDIDSTVLPVMILLYLYFLVYFYKYNWSRFKRSQPGVFLKKSLFQNISLAVIFALCLWTKITTPLVLPFASVLILKALGLDWKKAILSATLVSVLGAVLFLSTYFAFCSIQELPFTYTFKFLVASFSKGTQSDSVSRVHLIVQNLKYFPQFANWLTLPYIIAFFVSCVFLFKRKMSSAYTIAGILALIGLMLMMFYLGLISPFGGYFKYPFAGFALLIIPIALFISDSLRPIKIVHVLAILIASAIFAGFQISNQPDISIRESQPLSMLTLLLAGSISILLFKISFKKYGNSLKSILLVIMVGVSVGISREQALAPYPTKYYYGQSGLNETVEYLRVVTEEDEIIWSMKDVGYYVNNKYIENYQYLPDSNSLYSLLQEQSVRYFVMTRGIGEDQVEAYPEHYQILQEYATLENEFGNFLIFRAN